MLMMDNDGRWLQVSDKFFLPDMFPTTPRLKTRGFNGNIFWDTDRVDIFRLPS